MRPARDTTERLMNKTTTIALTTLTLGIAAPALAQDASSKGLINDWMRQNQPEAKDFDVGGQFRLRYEDREYLGIAGVAGAADFRADTPEDNNRYFLLRTKLHVGYKPCDWISAYVEGQDSLEYGDKRVPDPESDRLELHQAYVGLGKAKAFPLTAKVGRQELSYGDERLVGASDWNNIGRTFDAAKLRYEIDTFWVDGFISRLVIPDDNNFDMSNEYETFWGLYGGTKALVPQHDLQAYFLARDASAKSPLLEAGEAPGALVALTTPRDIYTVGTRLKSLPNFLGNWDYTLEGAYQFGRFVDAGKSLEQAAYAASLNVGYTFKNVPTSPRVAVELNYASGDSDPADGRHETFDNLFPTNHKFYGAMDVVSWQNMQNIRLNVSAKPTKEVSVAFDVNGFWVADKQDFFYNVAGGARAAGGYGRTPNAGNYVGTELDLVTTYSPDPAVNLQLGMGHFLVGDYPADSLRMNAGAQTHDASWVFAQLKLNF